MAKAVTAVVIVAATLAIAGCGGDDNPTTTASSSKAPASSEEKPSKTTKKPPSSTDLPKSIKSRKAAIAICKGLGGVSPNQRGVEQLLEGAVRCNEKGIITNGAVTISRPPGGWKTLTNP